jgi:hypothetical protein
VQAAETKPIFDQMMKTLAESMKMMKMDKRDPVFFAPAAVMVNMQIPKELKKTPRIVEKSQLRPGGMKGVRPVFCFSDVNHCLTKMISRPSHFLVRLTA